MEPFRLENVPAGARVVVAMSGGVDSATVAGVLVREGYEVVGITLQLYDQGRAVGTRGRTCCAGQDIHDARRVAGVLGIPHYVLDYESRFRDEVIGPFADSYARGETPVPCVLCNQTVKFRDLLQAARDLGASALATGHYARRTEGAQGPELHSAADNGRDQSYFLFQTTRDQLEFVRFPLGVLTKDETRALARELALPVASKKDSQDICFVPGGDHRQLVSQLRPDAGAPGEVVDGSGRVLGGHKGIGGFTVGQRRGLGVETGERLFVERIEPETRRVVAAPRSALARERVALRDMNWLGDGAPAGSRVTVKLRAGMAPVPGVIEDADGGFYVRLDSPAYGVAPGQGCVFYDRTRVLGGGWIAREDAARAA